MKEFSAGIFEYIQPGFVVLVLVLYFLGIAIKRTNRIPNNLIPILLSICGILLAGLGISGKYGEYANLATAMFDTVVQGMLCAGMSVYCNQIFKQCICSGRKNRTKK